VEVRHTSKKIIGQIYIPTVNYFVMVLTVLVIVGFNHSTAIAQAYGVMVCLVMNLTSFMFMGVMRFTWHLPLWKVLPFTLFLIVDLFFLASNFVKIPAGGWVSILFGAFFSAVMLCWYYGETQLKRSLENILQVSNVEQLKKALKHRLDIEETEEEQPKKNTIKSISFKKFTLREDEDEIQSSSSSEGGKSSDGSIAVDVPGKVILPEGVKRLSGMGVFLASSPKNLPISFQLFTDYICGVPETIVFLSLETVSVPVVPDEFKLEVMSCGSGIYKILGRFGYSEQPIKIENVLEMAFKNGLTKSNYTVFFHSEHIHIKRKNIFLKVILHFYEFMKRFFIGSFNHYKLPSQNVMSVGIQVTL